MQLYHLPKILLRFYQRFHRRLLITSLLISFLLINNACNKLDSKKVEKDNELTIYTYGSMLGSGSFGEYLLSNFSGAKLNFVKFGSATEVINQIRIEKQNTKADVIMGVDNFSNIEEAILRLFYSFDRKEFSQIENDKWFDKQSRFLPYDYGYFSFIYDEKKQAKISKKIKLSDFIENRKYNKKLVIQDPRTSSIGYGFLAYSASQKDVFDFSPFWKKLRKQIITITPSWSSAYSLFMKGEADFVLSYTTSPAYHRKEDAKSSIRALIFEEGNPIQVEGLALLKNSKKIKAGREFAAFVVSLSSQQALPGKNWMFPTNKNVSLPDYYTQVVPKVAKAIKVDLNFDRNKWITQWRDLYSK